MTLDRYTSRFLMLALLGSAWAFADDSTSTLSGAVERVETGISAVKDLRSKPDCQPSPAASPQSMDSTPFSSEPNTSQIEVRSLLSSKGILLSAWTQATDGETGYYNCRFGTSQDEGKTWKFTEPYRGKGYDLGVNPAIASDARGNLYAVCMSINSNYLGGELEFSVSKDNGRTWSRWKTPYKSPSGFPDKPTLIADDAGLHLVFAQLDDLGPSRREGVDAHNLAGRVMILDSTDQGKTWSKPRPLSSQVTTTEVDLTQHNVWGAQGASIASGGSGKQFASWGVYHAGGVYFSSRTTGARFSAPRKIASVDIDTPITQIASDPSGKNLVLVVNQAHEFSKTYWLTSHDSGQTWSAPHLLASFGAIPTVAVNTSGRFTLLWTEGSASTGEVKTHYAVSNNLGDSFGEPITLGTGKFSEGDALLDYQSLVHFPDHQVKAFWIQFSESDQIVKQTSFRSE